EVGNEVYFGAYQNHEPANVTEYVAFAKRFADEVQVLNLTHTPRNGDVKVGLDVNDPNGSYPDQWNEQLLAAAHAIGFVPGFLSDHYYAFNTTEETPFNDRKLLLNTVSDPGSLRFRKFGPVPL